VLCEKRVRNHMSNSMSNLQVADLSQTILRVRAAGLG